MKRRTLIRQLCTATLATTTLVGSAAAERPAVNLDVDREIDVSDVSGAVPLADLLDEGELASLPDDVDPTAAAIEVAAETDLVASPQCCDYMPLCCKDIDCPRTCNDCCYCYKCDDTA